MRKPTLVIMAAGMGSRFGGLKQMTPVDAQGHFIMDFSIFDAIRAGFGKVVCAIKEEMHEDFEAKIGSRVRPFVEVEYVYQKVENIPEGFVVPEGRVKPWGTAHAVLSAIGAVDGPFAVINADDFYGAEAFQAIGDFLQTHTDPTEHAMVGFPVENTLTENGSVSRGVCCVDANGSLISVTERKQIVPTATGAAFTEDGEHYEELAAGTVVSMNLWGFQRNAMDRLEDMFKAFLREEMPSNPLKAEFYLPALPTAMIADGTGTVQVLRTNARWYGVTYQQDLPGVVEAIDKLKQSGAYPENLWVK